ncbi:hypothetical protein [Mesorhizobium salmacidum]|uniref:Uncharacterized protein n=1 Tax=Mesorhizobium salmacidum TaxID=3015171 RepID=A0ABU8KX39_9HYPH
MRFRPGLPEDQVAEADVVWSMVVDNDAVTQFKQYRSFDSR